MHAKCFGVECEGACTHLEDSDEKGRVESEHRIPAVAWGAGLVSSGAQGGRGVGPGLVRRGAGGPRAGGSLLVGAEIVLGVILLGWVKTAGRVELRRRRRMGPGLVVRRARGWW